MQLPAQPLFRPLLALLLLGFVMQALRSNWSKRSQPRQQMPVQHQPHDDRLVIAHFMLGNTYPFTKDDWTTTFYLAEDTALDGFALNLGPEEWQLSQAHSAFTVLSSRPNATRPFELFLSMDMNVLPSSTEAEAEALLEKVVGLMKRDGYLRYQRKLLLSTFGGHDKSLGGWGWDGFLARLREKLGEQVLFVPAFFMPPDEFIGLPYVDGCYAWNNAWPLDNRTADLREDEPFLRSDKLYMASVSPLFSTHYGTTGDWAFNKNWIYRSDDLLLPTRFAQLIDLPRHRAPQIIQVISWNDYGESHSIAPVLGAEPGSQAWTAGMSHEAFREMVRYFATIWRNGGQEVEEGKLTVWSWYRPHSAKAIAASDAVGLPNHADWANDLLNLMILVPDNMDQSELIVHNGGHDHRQKLNPGRANALAVSFVPGQGFFCSWASIVRGANIQRDAVAGSGKGHRRRD